MRIALTFDDGPSQWTPAILDLLESHDAQATFFVTGHAVDRFGIDVLRVRGCGHEIGNHSYSHPNLTLLDDIAVEREFTRTSEAIFNATSDYPALWRPPYFATDQRVDRIASELGMTHVGCTVNPGDWAKSATMDVIFAIGTLKDNDIVDLHDGLPPDGGNGTSTRRPTVNAVEYLLDSVPEAEFVTVTELWASTRAA